jgi:4-amino-4-deoxy-L-arabinose transferase-like glycosyltransferase
LPRTLGLNDFYTTDEAYFWQGRVERFSAALSMHDWANTNQTGHPGVTTMWLGSAGRLLAERAGVPPPGPGAGAAYLSYLRLPLGVVNALAVSLGYLLLLRLVRRRVALLAAAFWATSPFLIAHSRLLHLDAMLTSLLSLSLLMLLVVVLQEQRPRPRWRSPLLLGSGLLAGLALLTKAPALLLPPFAGLLLLAGELRGAGWLRLSARALGGALWRASLGFGAWMGLAGLTFVALWPAMWVAPQAAIGGMIAEVIGNGGQPHSAGNYFMGQAVADPGWPFYLAVIRWRGEPLMGMGLIALGGLAIWYALRRRSIFTADLWPHSTSQIVGERRTLLALLCFALLFVLALSQMAKKFDRYLLPLWPALEIMAAIGLVAALDWWRAQPGAADMLRGRAARAAAGLALVFVLGAPLLAYAPYYLAYYNPLLGGGPTAQAVLLAGWGEGMNQVGAWLNARPDFTRGPVLSWLPETLKPFVRPSVAVYDLDTERIAEPANYAVVYTSVAERERSAVAAAYAQQAPPLFTLRVHGVTYATVHQLPRPYSQSVEAVFSGVHLRGFSYEQIGSTLLITPSWDIQVDRPGEVRSFVHVLDAQGTIVAQLDTPIDDGMFATWQAGQQFGTPMPVGLPADLLAGRYQVVLGLYTPADGARLPLTFGKPLPADLDGPQAIELLSLRLAGR